MARDGSITSGKGNGRASGSGARGAILDASSRESSLNASSGSSSGPEAAPQKRRKASKSPTARTLEHVRAAGGIAQVVEQTIPHTFIKRDLFGFADVFAITADGECQLIQVTSGSNVAARVAKAHAIIAVCPQLQLSGLKLLVHGWRKNADGRWVLRVVDLDDPSWTATTQGSGVLREVEL